MGGCSFYALIIAYIKIFCKFFISDHSKNHSRAIFFTLPKAFFGAYAWEGWAPLPYSLAYNAIYIFAEATVTVIILLLPPVKKALGSVKKMALE